MSVRASTGSPSSCSGLMYSGVPITSPLCVSASSGESVIAFAMPKSTTFANLFARRVARDDDVVGLEIAMDDAELVRGVQSVGDLPRDVDRAARIERAFARERSPTATRRRRTPSRGRRSCPLRRSRTPRRRSDGECARRSTLRARTADATPRRSSSDGFITLIAHWRFIFTCSARYTRPMPPSPSRARIR